MPHLDMARKYTTSEVLALLESDEDLSDDEVLAEGSDEEFDDFNELEEVWVLADEYGFFSRLENYISKNLQELA